MKLSYAAILIILAAAYLGLWRLDNTVFWDDETDIAIVAKNFLKFGRLTSWDGRNMLAATNGGALDENFRPRMPPLGYFVGAISFKLLGISTWSGRFPFVLAGLVSLILLAVALREDFGRDSPLWIYGIAAMGFSVSFLLYIRQCRYYSLAMLFSIVTFLIYRRCLNTGRLIYFILLSCSAILLFYSNFLLCAAFLGALVLVCAIFHGGELRKNWLGFSIAGVLFVLATVPYAVYYRIWYRPDIVAREVWYIRKLTLIWWNLRDLNLLAVMPWMACAGLFCFMLYYRKQEKHIRVMLEWVVMIAIYVLFLALLSPQTPKATMIADLRYFASIIPFLAGAMGMFIWFVHQKTRAGAIAILAIIITTNLPGITPKSRQFKWLLPAYIHEIHNEYPTAYGEVVRFLGENIQQDAKVFAWPECTNFPLMFYLGEKAKMSCLLNSMTTLPAAKIRGLSAPLMKEENFPDWIVFFRFLPGDKKLLDFFSRVHIEEMREVRFNYRPVKILDVYGEDTTRPELWLHSFGPKTDFNKRSEGVYIFKKIDN